jgi:transposase
VRRDTYLAGLRDARPPLGDERDHALGAVGDAHQRLRADWRESVLFLRHLRCYVADRLLVIWDGSPIHRSNAVKSYLANGGAPAIHLERLPAYAPDLNPDEGVWQHLKRVEMRNLCCADLDDLHHELRLAISRLRQKPQLIQSFFARVGLDI